MSATDELRRMLDERDEYYKTSGNKTWWGRPIDRQTGKPINVFHNQAQPMGEDRLLVELQLATPEQAIAATLGAGTLTAKQVMAIAGRHQPDYCSDTHVCFDWQAFVDELNATLGSCNCTNDCMNSERTGTCHADETDTWECVCDGIGRYGKRVTIHVMECSECGGTYEHVNGDYEFCPHCGRRVVDE